MANHLDLEEQEQLDQLKHFWNQYGNAITWCCIVVLGAFAAWNGYQYWQRSQATQAAAMFDEVQKVAATHDAEKLERAFNDMKERFSGTAYAPLSGLMVAKALYDAGKVDNATGILRWVAEKSSDPGYAGVARLRLAGILMDTKAYDDALKVLEGNTSPEFLALTADRRGDIAMAKGDKALAKDAYRKAYQAMDEQAEYRRLVEVKLNALGVDPTSDKPVIVKSEASK
jgi:predicted negative regulator of RcsB-dependent stress response